MKKTLFASALLFLTLITNAQTLEGEWRFEKVELSGILIYFDNTNKDKENIIKAYFEIIEAGMASEKEKDNSKKQINDNKELLYAVWKQLYSGTIKFIGDDFKEIYDGEGDGEFFFNYLNDKDKIERTKSKIKVNQNILEIYDKDLFENFEYEISLTGKKLRLTNDGLYKMIIYYEKKS